ncbi:heavy-metal-associated domain-containing protein [Burkholderia sp. Bp9142]|uniref:heavy-metal-associated domain-containing protein n=1 Tax=Burkholderia sp. Bp9142 TaxID=2184573 RepID=UPI000F5918E5|nr:heavy-metal-associated domain-containing protein [Burkholderia sp. Bp9142]RQR42478.1 copper chaperone [Burkholderia sp. Bp9142]
MELEIKDMTCGHCAGVVTKAIREVDANARVDIDLGTKIVRVLSAQEPSDFISEIQQAGYSPTVRS